MKPVEARRDTLAGAEGLQAFARRGPHSERTVHQPWHSRSSCEGRGGCAGKSGGPQCGVAASMRSSAGAQVATSMLRQRLSGAVA